MGIPNQGEGGGRGGERENAALRYCVQWRAEIGYNEDEEIADMLQDKKRTEAHALN